MKKHIAAFAAAVCLAGGVYASDTPDQPQGRTDQTARRGSASGARPGKITVNTSVDGTPVNVIGDSNEDTEPVISSNTIGTTTRHVVAYMKFTNRASDPNAVWIHTRSTTDFMNFTGNVLGVPTGHRSGDPSIAVNPYTTGFRPDRTYICGTFWKYNPTTPSFRPGGLLCWYSDTAGQYWSLPLTVATEAGDYLLDKSSTAVSWHSGTRGHVYIAAARLHIAGSGTNTLRVYRSNDNDPSTGEMRFQQMEDINTGSNAIWSPQIVVDHSNGDVYLLWLDRSTHTIYVRRSTDQGDTFPSSTEKTFSAGTLLWPGDSFCGTTGGCIQGPSALAARYSWGASSIGVVWHHREPFSSNTDVSFNSFSTSTQSWGTPVRVSNTSTNDQWNPALDYDEYNRYVVTYYDRRDDTNDVKFHNYATKLTSTGGRVDLYDVKLTSTVSDPAIYTSLSGKYNIGEYQDVWYWGGKWYNAHICIPEGGTQGNPCISKINP